MVNPSYLTDQERKFELPNLKGDKIRLTQVLINLIKNALKYTQRGSITVKSSYNFVEQQLVVHVEDTGYGIKQSDLSRLFKRYSKLEDPNKLN